MVEVITKIKTAEEDAEELKKAARRTAVQLREDAQSQGKRILEEHARKASIESSDILAKAEDAARQSLERSHQESSKLCDELKAAAKARLDDAAKFIVERIVVSL